MQSPHGDTLAEDKEKKIVQAINIEELSSLALSLARVHSPRGFERQVGDFIYDWMTSNGIRCFKQEAAEGRHNVVGVIPGTMGHPRLIFNSHMDTGFGLPEDFWINGPEENLPYKEGTEQGDLLIGRSIVNDKGPMAAFLAAGKAIKDSGVSLRGDVVMTCVVGEIGQAPIDEYRGSRYEGKGFGSRYLVTHGVVGDYAVVAERTNFGISRGETGDVWFKVVIYGKPGGIYAPMIERPFGQFNDNPNAIVRASKVVQAIEEWANRYEKDHTREFEDGVMVPKVNVGAIRGGMPVRISAAPSVCAVYVDVRLLPDQSPEEARKELEDVLKACDVKFSVEEYLYRRGYVAKNADRLIEAVTSAHQKVIGGAPGKVPTPFCSMWRDLNVFNEHGIPAITYGPSAVTQNYIALAGQSAPAITKKDLLASSKIYALTALELCG